MPGPWAHAHISVGLESGTKSIAEIESDVDGLRSSQTEPFHRRIVPSSPQAQPSSGFVMATESRSAETGLGTFSQDEAFQCRIVPASPMAQASFPSELGIAETELRLLRHGSASPGPQQLQPPWAGN